MKDNLFSEGDVHTFRELYEALLTLDREESDSDAAKYLMHRAIVNRRLRQFNFVIGVNHFNRHCILPLREAEK